MWKLLDASLDDERLMELTLEKKSKWPTRSKDMDIDGQDSFNEKITDRQEGLCKINIVMAIEIIGEIFQNKVISKILYLARRNMFSHWDSFIRQLRVLVANSTTLRNSKHISPNALLQLTSDARRVLTRECKTSLQK